MAIIITKQPSDIVAKVGTTVVFSIAVKGDVASYQWQRQLPNDTTWDNATAEGNTTNTLSYVCQHYNDGYKYRCIITDTDGTITYSDVAKLRIGAYGLIADFTLTAIADAIRAKTDSSDMILPADMAAMIEGIETGVGIPPSITEMEMVQVTMPSGVYDYDEVPYITVPCGMSEAPTGHVVWLPDQNWTSGRVGWICTDVRIPYRDTSGNMRSIGGVGGKIDLDFIDGINAGTWTLANGIATLTRGNSSKSYACGKPYTVIIWR